MPVPRQDFHSCIMIFTVMPAFQPAAEPRAATAIAPPPTTTTTVPLHLTTL
eukprot:COSAG06_NODE_42904_length_377_cov_0.794964_1_plen_50_part_10